jgi:hypothetical protein
MCQLLIQIIGIIVLVSDSEALRRNRSYFSSYPNSATPICKYERYGLKLPQICDGFLQGMQAMTMWWTSLQSVENKIDKLQASEFKIPITTNQG